MSPRTVHAFTACFWRSVTAGVQCMVCLLLEEVSAVFSLNTAFQKSKQCLSSKSF